MMYVLQLITNFYLCGDNNILKGIISHEKFIIECTLNV